MSAECNKCGADLYQHPTGEFFCDHCEKRQEIFLLEEALKIAGEALERITSKACYDWKARQVASSALDKIKSKKSQFDKDLHDGRLWP